jgi:parallel beta-helix repeat protein
VADTPSNGPPTELHPFDPAGQLLPHAGSTPPSTSCPKIPEFETNEGFDCGEGIHLSGVDHSTIAGNTVDKNAGGVQTFEIDATLVHFRLHPETPMGWRSSTPRAT